jgi:branched-chain amino acid transport system permease protein
MSLEELVQQSINGLALGSSYALLALGLAMVFSIMGLINFAHGELIMVGAYTIVLIGHPPWPVVVIATIAVTISFALAMERVAFRPLRGANPATLLIASFAVSYGLQNLAILIEGSAPQGTSVSTWLSESVQIGSVSIPRLDLVTIAVTLVLLIALGLFLQRTRMGVQMRAAAEDFRMARILGVNANTVIATAFAMSGVLAGIGAYLLVTQTGEVAPDIGSNPVLYAFVATVLGGMGSLRGAVLGGYVFGAIFVGLQAYLPLELRSYRDAFAFAAVIVMLLVRPQGLIVARSAATRV